MLETGEGVTRSSAQSLVTWLAGIAVGFMLQWLPGLVESVVDRLSLQLASNTPWLHLPVMFVVTFLAVLAVWMAHPDRAFRGATAVGLLAGAIVQASLFGLFRNSLGDSGWLTALYIADLVIPWALGAAIGESLQRTGIAARLPAWSATSAVILSGFVIGFVLEWLPE